MTAPSRRPLPSALGCLGSLLLGLGLWAWVARELPPFLLPSPGEAFRALLVLVSEPGFPATVGLSALRALGAFLGAVLLGVSGGVVAAHLPWFSRLVRPWMVALLGAPPVAWMVLTLLWFGSGHLTPLVTVTVTLLPGLFLGALEAERSMDPDLLAMARSFGASRRRWLLDLRLPNLAHRLRPVLSTSLGTAWKALVMVELLASPDGLGFHLGEARATVDVARALGWVLVMIALVALSETLMRLGLSPFAEPRGGLRRVPGPRPDPIPAPRASGDLAMEALGFTYPGRPVLSSLTLRLEAGARVALVGPSGGGKSTLLNLAGGLLVPSSGTCRGSFPRTAFVFQAPRLLPWATVLDNAAFGLRASGVPRREARQHAAALLLRMGLTAQDLGEAPARLSGGMAGRVAVARALLVAPDLLLLDEPAAALDPGWRREIQDLVLAEQRTRGMAFLWVTHDLLEALRVADRLLLLDEGRLREDLPLEPEDDPARRHAKAAELMQRSAFHEAF